MPLLHFEPFSNGTKLEIAIRSRYCHEREKCAKLEIEENQSYGGK